MRRAEREIEVIEEIEDILTSGEVLHLAMVDAGKPYVVPLNYGYKDKAIYFHSAKQGRKIDVLKNNPYVCFEVDLDLEITGGEMACDYSANFRSVIGYGTAYMVESPEDMRAALDVLMGQYVKDVPEFHYRDQDLSHVAVFKIEIESMTGKKRQKKA